MTAVRVGGAPTVGRERSPWRAVAVPSEHGGWGLTLEPVLLGLLVGFSWSGVAIGLATFLAFLVRTPLKLALVDRRRQRRLPWTRVASQIALVEIVAARWRRQSGRGRCRLDLACPVRGRHAAVRRRAVVRRAQSWPPPRPRAVWRRRHHRGHRRHRDRRRRTGRPGRRGGDRAGSSSAGIDPVRPHPDPPPPPPHAARRDRPVPGGRSDGPRSPPPSSTTASSWVRRPSCCWRRCRSPRSAARSRPPRSSACARWRWGLRSSPPPPSAGHPVLIPPGGSTHAHHATAHPRRPRHPDPSIARELEIHGLDYCCGGSEVAEACAPRLRRRRAIAELTTTTLLPPGRRWAWSSWSITSKQSTTGICGTNCHGCPL